MAEQANLDWKAVRQRAGLYPQAAFQFVRDGLAHTVNAIHGDQPGAGADRHVDGRQLCLGLRDFAIRQYGLLAGTVLTRWGVTKTDDFGRIVFAMIAAGIMRKSDEDSFEDFCGVFDFDESFSALELA